MILAKTLKSVARTLTNKGISFRIDFFNEELELTDGDEFKITGFGEAYEENSEEVRLEIYGDEPDVKQVMSFFYPKKKPTNPTGFDK